MTAETNYEKRMKHRNNPKGWKCGLVFENEVTKANRRKENDFMGVRIHKDAKTRGRNS